jgi:YVTN family beta-propeller protein
LFQGETAVCRRQFFVCLAFALLCAWTHAGEPRQKLYITNSSGNDVTVADVATNKVIGRIEVGPHPHGIAVPAAQDLVLVTIEGSKPGELVWIDPARQSHAAAADRAGAKSIGGDTGR